MSPTAVAVMIHLTDTVPYPWPFDGHLVAASLAVIVLGDQPAITERCVGVAETRVALARLTGEARQLGATVLHVRHRLGGRRGWAGTTGIDDTLTEAAPPGDPVVEAPGWDAMFASPLEPLLRARGLTTVALGGFGSEVTVDSTVRTLNDRGWECLVLTDACAPFDADLGRRAHASLTMSGGIFGALGTTDALLAALTRSTEATP